MNIPTLDKCPGYNLYIGGVISLRRPQALRNCNITHIVSVLDWKFDDDSALLKDYRHLHIPVDDVEDENLLEWFPRSNAFIQQGLTAGSSQNLGVAGTVATNQASDDRGSGVLIHCAMGKSRSATVLLAYLLWITRQIRSSSQSAVGREEDLDMVPIPIQPLSVIKALELLRQGRAIAEPNEGFMDQLHMYEAMGCPSTEQELKKHKIYRRWMNKRSVEESLRINQAPEMASIQFEDESESDSELENNKMPSSVTNSQQKLLEQKERHMQTVAPGISAPDGTLSSSISPANPTTVPSQSQHQTTIRCRKCRHILATTPFILPHDPPPHWDPNEHLTTGISRTDSNSKSVSQCAHVFLHPLSWMRDVLSEGTMEGRLSCPNKKCGANVGKFAWTGLRCSCGGWVTPGFGIIRGKVDEVVTGSKAPGHHEDGGSGGLRLPPGMVRRGNL